MFYPTISVVITAYNRKEYLEEALQSLELQTFEKDRFEVVLMTNFDFSYDTLLNLSVYNIGTCTVGEMLSKALTNSKGSIIAFLDDDDMFERNKLEKLHNIFIENPSIIYYHNAQNFVNNSGKLVNNGTSVLSGILTSEELIRDLPKLLKRHKIGELFFNLSSCAIKKEVYLDKSSELSKIKGHTDDFMFFSALNGDNNLYYDKERLTLYRIHDSSSRIKGAVKALHSQRGISLYEDLSISTLTILNMVENQTLKSVRYCRLVKESTRLLHLSKDRDRLKINLNIQLLSKYVKFDSGSVFNRYMLLLYYIFIYVT